jgi:hypothetical protein
MPITERGRWATTSIDEKGRIVVGNLTEGGQTVFGVSSPPPTGGAVSFEGSSLTASEATTNQLAIVRESPKYYLQLDGVDDNLTSATFSFNEVVMDWHPTPVNGMYYFDARPFDSGAYFTRSSGSIDVTGSIFSNGIYVDGVKKTNVTDMALNKRHTLKLVADRAITDNTHILADNANSRRMSGKLYSIKYYNAGVLVAHYDMSTGTVQDVSGNGNHATLVGGTFVELPKYYLQMDGVDDNLQTPSLTFDEVIMAIKTRQVNNSYYIDMRTGSASSYLFRNTSGVDIMSGGSTFATGIYVNEVLQSNASVNIPFDTKYVLRLKSTVIATDDVSIFSHNGGSFRVAGEIYNVKFLLNGSLVAHYDMSKGNALDQSGNGNHATLTGGTFVEEAPSTGGAVSFEGSSLTASEASTDQLRRSVPFEAQSLTASEASTAQLQRLKSLDGNSVTTSEVSLTLRKTTGFQGESVTASEVLGTIRTALSLLANDVTTSQATADLRIQGVNRVDLEGLSTTHSEATSALKRRLESFEGESSTYTEAQVTLKRLRSFEGESETLFEAKVDIGRGFTLYGSSITSSVVPPAPLFNRKGLQAESASTTEATGALRNRLGFEGTDLTLSEGTSVFGKAFQMEGTSEAGLVAVGQLIIEVVDRYDSIKLQGLYQIEIRFRGVYNPNTTWKGVLL